MGYKQSNITKHLSKKKSVQRSYRSNMQSYYSKLYDEILT